MATTYATETAQAVLDELEKANRIIHNALQLMTSAQKNKWAAANARDGVGGEGTTRRNERDAVIAMARG